MDLALALWHLDPTAEYRLSDDHSQIIEWRGPGTEPAAQQISDAWTAYQAGEQAKEQQASAAKQQTIDRFTATFHALNAMGGTAAAVPMLELALGLAQTIGADLKPTDLPPDLQQALTPPVP